jgi:hypothetical protein
MDVTGNTPPAKTNVPKSEWSAAQLAESTIESLSVYFTEQAQRDAIENYTATALSKQYDEETARDEMSRFAAIIFPNGKPTYNQCRTWFAYCKQVSEYLYKCAVRTVKSFPSMGAKIDKKTGRMKLGKLPSKDGGFKSGGRASAAVWQSSNAKAIKALRQSMQKNRKVIDPAVLKLYAAAFAAWEQALRADRKAS